MGTQGPQISTKVANMKWDHGQRLTDINKQAETRVISPHCIIFMPVVF